MTTKVDLKLNGKNYIHVDDDKTPDAVRVVFKQISESQVEASTYVDLAEDGAGFYLANTTLLSLPSEFGHLSSSRFEKNKMTLLGKNHEDIVFNLKEVIGRELAVKAQADQLDQEIAENAPILSDLRGKTAEDLGLNVDMINGISDLMKGSSEHTSSVKPATKHHSEYHRVVRMNVDDDPKLEKVNVDVTESEGKISISVATGKGNDRYMRAVSIDEDDPNIKLSGITAYGSGFLSGLFSPNHTKNPELQLHVHQSEDSGNPEFDVIYNLREFAPKPPAPRPRGELIDDKIAQATFDRTVAGAAGLDIDDLFIKETQTK